MRYTTGIREGSRFIDVRDTGAVWRSCFTSPSTDQSRNHFRRGWRPARCWSPLRSCRPLSATLCCKSKGCCEDQWRFIDSQAGIFQLLPVNQWHGASVLICFTVVIVTSQIFRETMRQISSFYKYPHPLSGVGTPKLVKIRRLSSSSNTYATILGNIQPV